MKRLLPLLALLVVAPLSVDAAPQKPVPSPTAVRKPKASPTPKYPEVKTESGLIIQDIVIGKGPQPQIGQKVTVHYHGRLLGGREFESSYKAGRPFTFVLGGGEVIRGWEEGVATMHVGGRRRLVIPPNLGYRDSIVGTIPPDSTLDFDIELLDVK